MRGNLLLSLSRGRSLLASLHHNPSFPLPPSSSFPSFPFSSSFPLSSFPSSFLSSRLSSRLSSSQSPLLLPLGRIPFLSSPLPSSFPSFLSSSLPLSSSRFFSSSLLSSPAKPSEINHPSFVNLQYRSLYVEKLKGYKPTSPGRRFRRIVDRSHLWKKGPMWHLTTALRKKGGRSSTGRITVRGRGGGHKRRYRMIDFKREQEKESVVERLEYDPNRTAWIALLKNTKKEEFSYIICPKNLEPGDVLQSGENAEIKNGNCLPLRSIPAGTIVHNVELTPGKGGQLARSAGTYAQVVKTGPTGFASIKLPSTEVRMVPVECRATIGVVSNTLHKNIVLGKAGASRWKGRRPKVRGVAMNPIDHPHGGGEGKGAPGRIPVSPWGKMAKSGKKTRNKHKFSNKYVVEPRKRGKENRK